MCLTNLFACRVLPTIHTQSDGLVFESYATSIIVLLLLSTHLLLHQVLLYLFDLFLSAVQLLLELEVVVESNLVSLQLRIKQESRSAIACGHLAQDLNDLLLLACILYVFPRGRVARATNLLVSV